MITILMMTEQNWLSFWEVFSTSLAFISMLALLIVPLVITRVTKKYLAEIKLTQKPEESKYYKIFEEFKTKE